MYGLKVVIKLSRVLNIKESNIEFICLSYGIYIYIYIYIYTFPYAHIHIYMKQWRTYMGAGGLGPPTPKIFLKIK
jgi:hypothetical protein